VCQNRLGTGEKSATRDRIGKVGARLSERMQAEALCHHTSPKADVLREYKPHPVASLLAGSQLIQYGANHRILRLDEM